MKPFNSIIPHISVLSASLVLSVSQSAFAKVTLNVEDNIKVTAINGQAVNTSMFKSSQQQFSLEAGKHVITAKYDRLYDLNKNDHDYLRSANITVSAELADNQVYQLVMPNQPDNYREAKKYADNPTLAIMKGSTVISSQTSQKPAGLLSGLGSTFGGWFGGGNSVADNTLAIASLDSKGDSLKTVNTANTMNEISTKKISTTDKGSDTLDDFMKLWLQATPEERERIRGWVSTK